MVLNSDFLKLSSEIGSNFFLVQGAGGNTSFKNDQSMWIKASGTWLMDSVRKNIFVSVDDNMIRLGVKSLLDDPLKGVLLDKNSLRPSIETTLHALMPHRIVIHTHPIELLPWLVLKEGKAILSDLLELKTFAWVDYIRPGLELAHAVRLELEKNPSEILFLGNHGLVVGGDDCESSENKMRSILKKCTKTPRVNPKFNEDLIKIGAKFSMRPAKYRITHSLATDEISYFYCNEENGILYPDQAVFLGKTINCYDNGDNSQSIGSFINSKAPPPYIIIKGVGVLVSINATKDVDEMLRCHAEVLLRIEEGQKLGYLTDNEVSRLLNWDAEKYRQTIK
ncbi:class II aldolase/adducin family protein [Candidatus Pseudothioglobus singularis]|nr:class II aldolase/adducin family protein [Candidatus Pseudothioglobus singularis]